MQYSSVKTSPYWFVRGCEKLCALYHFCFNQIYRWAMYFPSVALTCFIPICFQTTFTTTLWTLLISDYHTEYWTVAEFIVLWKADSRLVGHKFTCLLWTWRFITDYTRACHWILFKTKWIQSTLLHFISLRSNLMLSSHLCLGLPE
jgi:hypothetical protein